jgi:D-3-phosphoglycerate dehydrogenase
MLNVVATDGLDKEAQELLKSEPKINLTVKSGVPASDVVAALESADIAIIRSATNLTGEVLKQLPALKGVVRAGVGIDNIDIKTAESLGIWVWNAPSGNFQSTAELAIGLMFACARKIPLATEGARNGQWLKKEISASGRQLSGSTLGVFGAGNIGLRVAKMAHALGMTVQVCDPVYTPMAGANFSKVGFDELLAVSDFITIHSPLLPTTKHAFNLDAFRKMKRNAILVNAARGGIIHEADLVTALKENLIGGVGLDVFEKEPFDPNAAPYNELLKDPRVVITPHVGAATIEAQRHVGLETAEKIRAVRLSTERADVSAPKALNNPATPRLALRFS